MLPQSPAEETGFSSVGTVRNDPMNVPNRPKLVENHWGLQKQNKLGRKIVKQFRKCGMEMWSENRAKNR